MFARLGEFNARYWYLVILFWAGLVVSVRLVAPPWDDVTHDGDLAYLPADRPSVAGQKMTEAAFPDNRSKSQIALIVARKGEGLRSDDLRVADDLAKRFVNLFGAGCLERGRQRLREAEDLKQNGQQAAAAEARSQAQAHLQAAQHTLDDALRLDEGFAAALHNRALLREQLGHFDLAEKDRQAAWKKQPKLQDWADRAWPDDAQQIPLVDVWTRLTDVFGSKLRSDDRQAQLIILHLSNEFMATDNIRVMKRVEEELEAVRQRFAREGGTGLTLGISGSAAVGGDMLRSAAESIKNTELYTIALVVTILLIVYRAPLLITVPLVTIAASLSVATGLLALLTQLGTIPGFEWWGFKIFKTSKIFIVVILFGAGTDFCLFLIARYREHLAMGLERGVALARSLASVGDALTASALTTILGLAMMFFADFGKFRNSGPAIGLCLGVALVACLTLAPAMLRALGQAVFWPFHRQSPRGLAPSEPSLGAASIDAADRGLFTHLWRWLARRIVRYPGPVLLACFVVLTPLARVGYFTADHVTFDLLSELANDRPSQRGSELLKRHFPVGEAGPVIVLAVKKGAGFDDEDDEVAARAMGAIFDLTKSLRSIDGVRTVRSLAEPLGDPPQRLSLVSKAALRKLALREHRLTKSIFVAQGEGYRGDVTRFELVLVYDPFSKEAMQALASIDEFLQTQAADSTSFWGGAEFVYTGTTAGIRDLRAVTRSDGRRIRILVVAAVFAVLLAVLRRPVVCLFLILSVLFSYLVTIGATELFFKNLYQDSFQGLDWKVPVFLFVILVAVGQDYNIYLVTRVFQEQQRRGLFAGLREAIVRTGGIITSCGVIMAGTFISMTTGTLRGIVELGFALSLGVLLDTFVIRTLLVPAFLSLWCRWHAVRKWQSQGASE